MSARPAFTFPPLDLRGPSFRLIELLRDTNGHLQCTLQPFSFVFGQSVPAYKALSYTWGRQERDKRIDIGGRWLSIPAATVEALEAIRSPNEDQILWVDAICINEGDNNERVHQIRHMSLIYQNAAQVIVWLGRGDAATNLLFTSMIAVENQIMNLMSNIGISSDAQWNIPPAPWSVNALTLTQGAQNHLGQLTSALLDLLQRPWFKRLWVLQEIGNACSARIKCGSASVSARVFALFPPLLGIEPTRQQQDVLKIFPGPSRNNSWWTRQESFRELLIDFWTRETSEPRDKIYALLGMAHDAPWSADAARSPSLIPDYAKREPEVLRDTLAYLLQVPNSNNNFALLPQWELHYLMKRILNLTTEVLCYAVDCNNLNLVQYMLGGLNTDANVPDISGTTPLLLAVRKGYTSVVVMLLSSGKIDVDQKEEGGPTAFLAAAQGGHDAIVSMLLATRKVKVLNKDTGVNVALLSAAIEGHDNVVRLLLGVQGVNVNRQDDIGRTPLSWAAEKGHVGLVRTLLGASGTKEDLADEGDRTPLSYAAQYGHLQVVNLLMRTNRVAVNHADHADWTPTWYANDKQHQAVVQVLQSYGGHV